MTISSVAQKAPEGEARLSSGAPSVEADRGARASAGPLMDLVGWMATLSRLASLSRFSMERLSSRESVMEHLGQVSLTALALATECDGREPKCVSVASVVMRALVHDLEEAVTGDIARPTKHASPAARQLFEALTESAAGYLAKDLESSMPHFARSMYWHHQRAKKDKEGCVVALADILAVVTKVWEEVVLRGSGAMIRQAHTATRQLLEFQVRLDREFERGPANAFLSQVTLSALEVMRVATERDSKWYGTKVERY